MTDECSDWADVTSGVPQPVTMSEEILPHESMTADATMLPADIKQIAAADENVANGKSPESISMKETSDCEVAYNCLNLSNNTNNNNNSDSVRNRMTTVESTVHKQCVCDVCNRLFSRRSSLTRHKRNCHHFPCSHCSETFTELSSLQQHIKCHENLDYDHLVNELKSEKDSVMDIVKTEVFDDYSDHPINLTRDQVDQLPQYKCLYCFTEWNDFNSFTLHTRSHVDWKKHECTKCGKNFAAANSLRNHIRVMHSTERPYCCDHCQKAFAHPNDLKRHMKCHVSQSEKPYVCSVCDKRFAHRTSLRQHMRIHTGAKDFSCMLCGKEFVSSQGLNLHIITTHSEHDVQYDCKICGKVYTHPYSQKRHMQSHKKRAASQLSADSHSTEDNSPMNIVDIKQETELE